MANYLEKTLRQEQSMRRGWIVLLSLIVGFVGLPMSAQTVPQKPSAAPRKAAPSQIHLTVVGSHGVDEPHYDFGRAHVGLKVVHTFLLRNDTKAPIVIQHVQTSCGCMTTPVSADGHDRLTVAPGALMRFPVTLDTGRAPEVSIAIRTGQPIDKQVWIYAVGQPVHAAAILTFHGRISGGVAFDPPQLAFGQIDSDRGVVRTVRVIFAPGMFAPGRTRLRVSGDSPLRVTAVDATPPSKVKGAGEIARTYRIEIAPHAPIGLLSGQLTVEGLAVTGPSVSKGLPSLAFAGEVIGSVHAEPRMALFGLVRKEAAPGSAAAQTDDLQRRTRWILLTHDRTTGTAFWTGATTRVDTPSFRVALVALDTSSTRVSTDTPSPPAIPAAQRPPGTARWLRVTLLPNAPPGKLLTGTVTVALADGERIRLPILAQMEKGSGR